jgi:homoserine/homoserine lactone efflux protein
MIDQTLFAFCAVVTVTVATPGPTVLLALSNGSRYGFARAGAGILGAGLSDLVLMVAVALGLGAVLATSAFWFAVIKWLGVAYLVLLGVQMLRSDGHFSQGCANHVDTGVPRRIFRKSFLVAVTNPKGYLFFAAFLPQFVDMSQPLAAQYATLAAYFVAIDVAIMAVYAGLGAKAMQFLRDNGAMWLERCCGGVMLILAGGLAFYRRA